MSNGIVGHSVITDSTLFQTLVPDHEPRFVAERLSDGMPFYLQMAGRFKRAASGDVATVVEPLASKPLSPDQANPSLPLVWRCAACRYNGNFRHWETCAHCGERKPVGAA